MAKLDRLCRNAAFLLSLRDAGVRFVAVDLPDMNETGVGIMALDVVSNARQRRCSTLRQIAVHLNGLGIATQSGQSRLMLAAQGQ